MSTVAPEVTVSRGALWFGLFGGALAWTVHLMLAYATAEFGCVGRLAEQSYLGITLVAWLEVALTLATALTSAAATVVAYRSHRRLSSDPARADAATTAECYTAWAGVLTSGMFTFTIFFQSIPILYYLNRC